MRLLKIILVFIVFQNPGFCQEESFRKNTISVESGIWSRGLVGLSYSRNFLKRKFLFMSADAFAGIGASGYYYGLNTTFNFGRNELFFTTGFDVKKCEIQFSENQIFSDYYFKGPAYNPFIGLNLYAPAGLSIKTRAGIMPIYKNHTYDGFFPSMGVSLGYSF